MENHPIPQDVTGFQFRLIGSMTVKQFAYIAASTILVIVIWYFPGIPAFLKLPLLIIFGGLGPALSFLPIEGRPMDQMAAHFAKALVSPNQYVFHKAGGKLPLSLVELKNVRQLTAQQEAQKKAFQEQASEKEQKLALYLNQIHQPTTAVDDKEAAYMQRVLSNTPPSPTQIPTAQLAAMKQPAPLPEPVQQPMLTQPTPLPQPEATPQQSPAEQEKQLLQEEATLKKELEDAKKAEAVSQTPQEAASAHEKATELEQKLQEALSEKAILERELLELKNNLQAIKEPAAKPPAEQPTQAEPAQQTPAPQQPAAQEPHVRTIEKSQAPKVGIPTLPDVPNLIMGIVKDPRGNILPNILVEVKDKDDNPVRAFKTNALGQFAAATALQNGTYTIVFEDPKGQHSFDIVELELSGKAISPIEVISHDAREALRQQLFG